MDIIEYLVRSGDTLHSIAWRHSISIEALCGINGLNHSDIHHIHVGRLLMIPKPNQPLSRAFSQHLIHRIQASDPTSKYLAASSIMLERVTDTNDGDTSTSGHGNGNGSSSVLQFTNPGGRSDVGASTSGPGNGNGSSSVLQFTNPSGRLGSGTSVSQHSTYMVVTKGYKLLRAKSHYLHIFEHAKKGLLEYSSKNSKYTGQSLETKNKKQIGSYTQVNMPNIKPKYKGQCVGFVKEIAGDYTLHWGKGSPVLIKESKDSKQRTMFNPEIPKGAVIATFLSANGLYAGHTAILLDHDTDKSGNVRLLVMDQNRYKPGLVAKHYISLADVPAHSSGTSDPKNYYAVEVKSAQ